MTTRVNLAYPVDALVSFHYYRDDKFIGPLAQSGRLRLIGDSGAFSAMTQGAPIALADYAAWCTRWRDNLFWCASLDVIGDPETSLANWRTLRDRYGLATVPTIHLGTDAAWLEPYVREGVDFFGLGGMVGKPTPALLRWAVHMLRYARDRHPNVRFHGWGQAGRTFLDAVPVYSADSSGALGQSYRYGRLRLFDPSTGRDHSVNLDGGSDVLKLAPLLRRVYGVDPQDIRTSHPANRPTLIKLAAASVQQYAGWLQRRHQVTAPSWGINPDAPGGPRVHLMSAGKQAPDATDIGPLIYADEAQSGGPRVHVVGDGFRTALPVLNDGPRVCTSVDGSPTNLAATIADQEQEIPA